MDPNHGADELELDDQFTEPLALVQANQQGTRQQNTSCTWTPVANANAMTLVPLQQVQATENRIPGPAGRPTNPPNGGSGKSVAQGGGGGWSPPEFLTSEWQAGLRLLNLTEFQETHPLLVGNTVHAATSLQQSGIIPRLLLYVVSMQHTHTGESYVKFRDPSGAIGGTFVSDILSMHQNITRGAVVLLEKVTVLKTPAPHSIHHLCIVPENIVSVIPRQRRSGQGAVGGLSFFGELQQGGGGGGVSARQQEQHQGPPQLEARAPMQAAPPVQQQQQQARPQQQQQVPTAPAQPPQQPPRQQQQPPPSHYVPPQVDTADDLLDGLDDEFGF